MSIVTLTMNPAIDISADVARVLPTHKLRCTSVRRDPGGGGINVARVIARLGGEVRAIYPVGGPIGDLLRRLVDAEDLASEARVPCNVRLRCLLHLSMGRDAPGPQDARMQAADVMTFATAS